MRMLPIVIAAIAFTSCNNEHEIEDIPPLTLMISKVTDADNEGGFRITAEIRNRSNKPIAIKDWQDLRVGCNFELRMTRIDVTCSSEIREQGDISNNIIFAPITLASGQVVTLSGYFNPKRDKGLYSIRITSLFTPHCESKRTKMLLPASSGESK